MWTVLVFDLVERERVVTKELFIFPWPNSITKVLIVALKATLPDCNMNSSMMEDDSPTELPVCFTH